MSPIETPTLLTCAVQTYSICFQFNDWELNYMLDTSLNKNTNIRPQGWIIIKCHKPDGDDYYKVFSSWDIDEWRFAQAAMENI